MESRVHVKDLAELYPDFLLDQVCTNLRKSEFHPDPKSIPKVSEAAEVDNMYQLLAVSSFRKDRFVAATNRFVLNVMGPHFYSETEMDLAKIVEEEVRTMHM